MTALNITVFLVALALTLFGGWRSVRDWRGSSPQQSGDQTQ